MWTILSLSAHADLYLFTYENTQDQNLAVYSE